MEYERLRAEYEKVLLNQITLTNDLNEKDDKIQAYKKREGNSTPYPLTPNPLFLTPNLSP